AGRGAGAAPRRGAPGGGGRGVERERAKRTRGGRAMNTTAPARPVVVTRAEGSDGPLSRELRGMGLQVLSWPAVSTEAADLEALHAALAELQSYGWLVFASRHAVAAVIDRRPAAPVGVRVAAVGRASAPVLRHRRSPVHRAAEEANPASLIQAFAPKWRPADAGVRLLCPASSRALPTIAAGLRQLGAVVTQGEAYRTTGAALDLGECRA